ncbi:MAG: sulfite exporter TauE/SafE family protein [Candidatus Kapaibacterium sp.]
MTSLVFAVGVAIGILMGLLGGGGSIMAVPVFVYLCGMSPKLAIVLALVIVGCTSAVGVVPHLRRGNVDARRAAVFAALSSVGAFLGARVSIFVTGEFQLLLFSVVMAVASFFMIRPTGQDRADAEPPIRQGVRDLLRTAGPAVGVGVLTGIVGVGGGFMIVPVLTLILGMDMRKSIGTSLLVIALNSAVASLGYLSQDGMWGSVMTTDVLALPLSTFAPVFLACTFAGVIIGSRLSDRVPPSMLKRAFGFFLLSVSVMMISQRLGWW